MPFAFLEEIKHRFVSAYGTAATSARSAPRPRPPVASCGVSTTALRHRPVALSPLTRHPAPSPASQALAYAYNTEFSRVLHQQMEYFSSNPSADAITRVKGDISEVKSVMVENIDKVGERAPSPSPWRRACVGLRARGHCGGVVFENSRSSAGRRRSHDACSTLNRRHGVSVLTVHHPCPYPSARA